MKLAPALKIFALSTFALTNFAVMPRSQAASPFDEQAVVQEQFIAIAAPFGEGKYNLVVMEQIEGKQICWQESGTGPVVIDPTWLTFNFTGHCRRGTDPNAYSIRMDGQDLGLDYILRITPRDGSLVLIGTPRVYGAGPEMLVGHTQGITGGYLKIFLNPGWQFSKRTYQGKVLGHVYFSGSRAAIFAPEPTAPGPDSTVTTEFETPIPAPEEIEIVPTPETAPPTGEVEPSSSGATPDGSTPLQEKIFVPAAPTIRSNSTP